VCGILFVHKPVYGEQGVGGVERVTPKGLVQLPVGVVEKAGLVTDSFEELSARLFSDSTDSGVYFVLRRRPARDELMLLVGRVNEIDVFRFRGVEQWGFVKGRKGRGSLPHHIRDMRDRGLMDVWFHNHSPKDSDLDKIPGPNDVINARKGGIQVNGLLLKDGITLFNPHNLVDFRSGGVWNPTDDELEGFLWCVNDPSLDPFTAPDSFKARKMSAALDSAGVRMEKLVWSSIDANLSFIDKRFG